MKNRQLKLSDYLIIASLIFGMFFGAGNLIFPVHLGQLAGGNWITAALGFLLSGVCIPLLAILAISATKSGGIYDLAKPISPRYALIFLILVHATLGPLFATPRTATVSYALGIEPYIPKEFNSLALAIYSALFFLIVYAFSVRQSKILSSIGKLLNPLFLGLLLIIFLLGIFSPMGNSMAGKPTTDYITAAFANGFLEGYNTMDALAALAFGITIITAIKMMGVKDAKQISLATAKAGTFGILGIALVYVALIFLGATSLNQFKLADNGGVTLTQISHYYLGNLGNVLLALLATVGCLTTAMGLVIAFAQDFHQRFPRFSYKQFLIFNCFLSFLVANLGLDLIITWSIPVLMFLYPLSISLIILGLTSSMFDNDKLVYRITTIFTLVPAIFDMLKALPPVLSETTLVQILLDFAQKWLPLFSIGFAWLPFSILGFILGLGYHKLSRRTQIEN